MCRPLILLGFLFRTLSNRWRKRLILQRSLGGRKSVEAQVINARAINVFRDKATCFRAKPLLTA